MQERAVPFLEEPRSSELSSSFPETRESKTAVSEADIMAEEQPRRVTLEDYSSSIVS